MMDRFALKALSKILEGNRVNQFEPDFYKSLIGRLKNFPVFEYNLIDASLIRSVKADKVFFDNFKNIAVKPKSLITEKSRCNLENESVFYGSLFVNDDMIPRIANMMEIERLNLFSQPSEYNFIHSRYYIEGNLKCIVIDFPFDKPKFKLQNDIYELINGNISCFDKDLVELYKLFVKEFRKYVQKDCNDEYSISASYSSYVFNTKFINEKCFDAIIYPSVQVDGLTYNICIKQSSIEKIRFIKAGLCSYGFLNGKFSQKSTTELELQGDKLNEVRKHYILKYL